MRIENSAFVVRERKLMYLSTISLTILIPIIFLADFFNTPVLGLNRELYIIGIALLYILLHLYRYWLNLNFIEAATEDNKLVFRYYSLRFFSAKHKSIEIPLADFIGFEINQPFKGLKKSLILFQRMKNKKAKYPPISISALTKEQIAELETFLKGLSKSI
ncbi:MAG TPA: hypothetical protein PK252_04790 [Bacteroidales bacterium]|nr:hypothetical protein [Bacteroidales bacterium]